MQHNVDELLVGILKQIRLKIQMTEQMLQGASSSSSSSRSLFRKRSGRRRQQQHRVNYQTEDAAGEGSCCISTAATGGASNRTSSTNRRSTSLRVRRMLGKAVWTCAEYYHRNKSRSCEDLHVLWSPLSICVVPFSFTPYHHDAIHLKYIRGGVVNDNEPESVISNVDEEGLRKWNEKTFARA